ncbi:hypothetical protein NBH00_15535 [Paraconexibacter antarcticus]|uniref:Uncharacterized protein n=1 Tax=Paraconexibacter antarcticus TaxID=2949664 RepID=A0ABY5DQB3_9ACTN|nr:hypothetical protein [Paraconexibacter antarcticus]UTI62769.1 hypothetical protein NBH00_15535 [Paraconexibacter antarcticus]
MTAFEVPPVPTVAVTNHAAERFRQRVGSRTGEVDVKSEIAGRVARAWAAGRVDDEAPPGATGARGSLYVRCLVDRAVVYVCRYDRAGREALVITLWEGEGGVAPPRVGRRFTNALKDSDAAVEQPGRWAEDRRE